ncbi:hypothetical protein A2419_02450 [Candidatus Adlerbacteria bacterium RIFOXYC1_FULL_48_26]|uniref:Uncharacterized protein n=1 Tax=Candidatus Adlerbacteria bacterium RIFOXYC1_FULL_48_26 TaxID=1797247 RepID=A0A1F4Y513_9BACT|nr:MAG: hypothetical protein A2419_02450 [Candidatus Adlerbacteria bacterium RIFOXYC1_FULL_48_26]OGC96140.1 MAG: hypothetical protein A2590_01505 [Candidatus Adlerbacteria bacterium RIFOXYD1_FULL_48_8]
MWDKRIFLLLLMYFQDGQKRHLSKKEYAKIITHGIDSGDFIRFSCMNWGLFSALLFFLRIKKTPKEEAAIEDGKMKYEYYDFVEKFHSLAQECIDEKLIKEDTNTKKILLRYKGREFIKFTPFYRSLILVNGSVWVTVGGFMALMYGFHKPVINFLTSEFSRILN